MDTIRKEGKDMRILEVHQHVVPTWALGALINGDTSGNTEEDIDKICRFTARCVELADDNLWHLLPTGEKLGFRTHNALDNMGADCEIVEQVILETPSHEDGYRAAMARLEQEITKTRNQPHARAREEAREKLSLLEAARDIITERTGTWKEREEHAKATILQLRTYQGW